MRPQAGPEDPGGAGREIRMLLVGVESLRPGMTLARPVLHPDRSDLLLLGEGYTIDAAMVDHLRRHGVMHAWIAFPGLEEVDPRVSEKIGRSHMELYQVLSRSVDHLEQRVSVKTNIQHYKRAVHHMLAEIVDHPDHDVIMHQLKLCGPRLVGHQANCAYLALLVGAHLSGYLRSQRKTLNAEFAENTAQLGLGALLHDVGKLAMTDDLRGTTILDERSAWPEYRYHAQSGYQEVRDHLSPVAATTVLHHHQRYDGTGFPAVTKGMMPEPEPLSGDRIHVFARVVAVIDVLDHLLCPHGRPVPTIIAVSHLRSPRFHGWFDPVILETVLKLVPSLMVGQVVRLSDETEAVVTVTHPDAPLRPTVKVLTGPVEDPSSKAAPRPIDLRMARQLSIIEVDGVDIRPYLAGNAITASAA